MCTRTSACRGDGDNKITYEKDDVPTHYGFTFASRLDSIEREYRRLLDTKLDDLRKVPAIKRSKDLDEAVAKVIKAQNADGAWTETGTVRSPDGKKVTPKEGVVRSETFVKNEETLCRWLKAQ